MDKRLTEKQLNIIQAREPYIIVNSCAGSGKTLCLIERIKYLIEQGIDPKEMVAITFTNSAAETMRERLGEKGKGVWISTIHSYANYLLMLYGIDTRDYLDKEDFDSLFKLVKDNPNCIKHVSYLLWDEGQDQTDDFFDFILYSVNPDNWTIFCDVRQSIYGWNNANPERIFDLMNKEYVTCYLLNDNFRNAPQILSYAKDFLEPLGFKYEDNSISKNKTYGQVYRLEFSAQKIGRFILDNEESQFGDWFVLTRTNKQLAEVQQHLESMGIPCETFKKAELSNSDLKKKMENNTVKVLTIHTSKGLEAKNVVVVGAQYYNDEERRINYVAATRAKELLVWCTTPKRTKRKYDVESWD